MSMNISGLGNSYNGVNTNSKQYKALEENGLTDQVNLSAAFCLGKCTHGVTIKVDDEIITGVSPETFPEIFQKYVLTPVKG